MTRQRVLILYGGRSSEHEISCLSASSVLAVIDHDRYDVVPVGITREGRWELQEGPIEPPPGEALPAVAGDGDTVALVRGRHGPRLIRFTAAGDCERLGGVDVCFPILHGPYGEDGTVQGLLASLGVSYVGADVTASSVGIDKRAAKALFGAQGLPQGPYLPVRREHFQGEPGAVVEQIEGALTYPVFTKPARQGSSIGITKCHDPSELPEGLATAFAYDRIAIVEQGFDSPRELEVGVLGNEEVRVTAPGEVRPSREFYDFEAKYLDDSELVVPAPVSAAVAGRIEDHARRAYQAIGCRGMARVDFFLDGAGDLWVNEINTIPGFTPSSMFPRLWEAEGIGYPALVDRLLALALEAAE